MRNINNISDYPSNYEWLETEKQNKILELMNTRQKVADEYWNLCKNIYEDKDCLELNDYKTIFTVSIDKDIEEKLRIYNNMINFISGARIAYATLGIMLEYNWPNHKNEWILATIEDAEAYLNAPEVEGASSEPITNKLLLGYGDVGI